MALPLTKRGVDVAAPTDAAGNARKPVPQDFQTLFAEYEALLLALAADELDIDLSQNFLRATNAGEGTPNAIEAATDFPIPEGEIAALVALNIRDDNTASPVTVEFNDSGEVLTIKDAAGNDIPVGGFGGVKVVAGYIRGDEFRLLSDYASAAHQAAAEAARDIAVGAADQAAEDRDFIENQLIAYVDDDTDSVTIVVSETMVAGEGTEPYPHLILTLATA